MNRLINIIGTAVLVGILIKLSYVFIFLFDELDDGSIVGQITGVTFAFASVYFVVKIPSQWLKFTMVILDISTILYYYLHSRLAVPIEYASVIVAAYSGLIVYYLGKIVSEQLRNATEQTTEQLEAETLRLQKELRRLQADSELHKLETEKKLCLRRINESKTETTRLEHEKYLQEIDLKIKELKNKEL
jgi:hypothetical protein